MFILLFLLWIIFNGRITLEIIVFGAVICGAIELFAVKYLDYNPTQLFRRVHLLPHILKYGATLFIEIIKSSLYMINLVLSPKVEVKPLLVFFDSPFKKTISEVVLANSITLTPGTVTADISDGKFCVHAINPELADGIESSDFVEQLLKMEELDHD